MSTGDPPKITVMIPVFNREKYLGPAIESILAQTFKDFELLLIDDGSSDGSLAIMKSYSDPRIRVVRNDRNLGIPKTRNRALELARGEYTALLDSDDTACPDRLAKQAAFLDRHPDHAMVGGFYRLMDEAGRPLKKVKKQPLAAAEIQAYQLFRGCLYNRTTMGRTAIMRELRYNEDCPVCEDYDLFVRLAEHHKLANLPEILAHGRQHGGRIIRERAALVKAKNLEIMGPQLDKLGIDFTDADLERHFFLTPKRSGGGRFRPDAAYLAWAADWLCRLREANRQTGRYDSAAFERVLGTLWYRLCKRPAAGSRAAAWKQFWRPPLRNWAFTSLWSGV
jgi:glycosyltransferase involved in cell wall biosynthesis